MIWWHGNRPDPAALNSLGEQSLQAVLGIEVVSVEDDRIIGRMPIDRRTHQPWGRLHGGASVALAETLGTIAAVHTVDPDRFMAVGMEINANHVRPAHEGWAYATATPEARGRTSQVWTIRITNEGGRLICISRFTVAIIALGRS